nr:uncharacterized protein LOC112029899 [Quercus suber]
MSHAENNKKMQLEIDQLKRELHHAKRKRTSSYSNDNSDDEQDITYKRRSRTPVSESFSYEEEHYRKRLELIKVDRGVQRLVYYVSKSLHEAEIRYLPLEKAILAVVLGTRKLPHYFQAHTVVVLTQLPLKTILRSADYTGRITKWGTILGAFDIKYMPRTSTKGQVLADLVAKFTEPSLEELTPAQNMDEKSVGRMGGKSVEMFLDSRLVVGQVQGKFEVKDERINSNSHADSLATLATSSAQNLPQVILVEDLYKPTKIRKEAIRINQIIAEPSWMDPIIQFLKEDTLPEARLEVDKVRRKATRF